MKITKRLNQFIKEVAETAMTEEGNSDLSLDQCIAEYTDQITNDDYFSVVCYADYKGITIPRSLKGILKERKERKK